MPERVPSVIIKQATNLGEEGSAGETDTGLLMIISVVEMNKIT